MSERIPSHDKEWVGEIDSWRVVDDTRITYDLGDMAVRGEVLIGPWIGSNNDMGGQAFFPPGVCSYLPEDSIKKHTSEGWRHGIWEKLEHYEIINHEQSGYPIQGDLDHIVWVTGRERPLTLSKFSIDEIMEIIEAATSQNKVITDFMKTQMAKRGASIWTALAHEPGQTPRHTLESELKNLQVTAAGHFENDWVLDNLVFSRTSSDS